MTLNLNGLIPATVLPMDADGGIDEPALRSYIGWVVAQGPVALAINVDTGEGPHLTHDEKVRILQDRPRRHGHADRGRSGRSVHRRGRAPGAGLPGRRRGRAARVPDPGLPEPAARPPRAGRLSRGHRRRRPADDPVPAAAALAGVNFETETLQAMAAVDGVVAIKEASFDARRFVDTARLAGAAAATDHAPDRQRQLHPGVVHAGCDRCAHRLRRGDDPRAGRHDRRLAGRRHRDAMALGRRVQRLADVVFAAPVGDYRVRLKECLRILGVLDAAHVRRPLLPISDRRARASSRMSWPRSACGRTPRRHRSCAR